MATVIKRLCKGCGICSRVCSRGAIRIIANVAAVNGSLCDDCEECVFACPNGAISG